jgi:hypothetical protein
MTSPEFSYDNLRHLLRRRADDAAVVRLIGGKNTPIERSSHLGFVEFKPEGVSVMFKEAPWIIPLAAIGDPKALHVSAFHFHRQGHEGYTGYTGSLGSGASLGDSEQDLQRKLGPPSATGGGGMSKMLRKPIPRWIRYEIDDYIVQYQLDSEDRSELVTLYVPDVNPLP